MKPVVLDATPLIYLTRVGLVNVLEAVPTRKFTAREVYREVVERGRAKGSADALALARLFQTNAITVLDPSDKALLHTFLKIRGLEEADAETLAIAKERHYRAVLDDLLARKVARTYAIDFVGTPHLLILGMQNRLLTKEQALKALDNMIEAGWRCGPEVYREITRLIKEN